MILLRTLALAVLGTGSALAVPLEFTHSARVLDPFGVPFQGSHTLTVSLYDAVNATTPVWSETQTVDLQDGYVTVRLGADPANPLDTDLVFDGTPLWVGLTVDAGAELPVRTPLGSVPYAMRAGVATDVDGGKVVLGDPGATCTAAEAGTIRYAGGVFQGCDGAVWQDLQQDTLPTAGTGIAVSGAQVSLDNGWLLSERRLLRYHATCASLAGSTYLNVAAVTPGDDTVTMTGNQVCNAYVGNNGLTNWTCIGVPYVYHHVVNGAYLGTDVRPTWRDCATALGPNNPTTGNYPWHVPGTSSGVMMACCVK